MKIALPTDGNQLDGHFGHCAGFTIFTVNEAHRIVAEEKLVPPPGCGCKSNVIPELASRGVTVMLAGSMGGGAVNLLEINGIQVVRGCSGDAREVTEAWLAQKIVDSGTTCDSHGGNCGHHG